MSTSARFISLTDDFGKTLVFEMAHVLHCAVDPFERYVAPMDVFLLPATNVNYRQYAPL